MDSDLNTSPTIKLSSSGYQTWTLYTYIIGHYNTLVKATAQLLPPLMLCMLILVTSGGICNLKSTSFFEKLFVAILFTLRVFVRNLLRLSHRRNVFFIPLVLMSDLDLNLGLTSNKPIHYQLDCSDRSTINAFSTLLQYPGSHIIAFFISNDIFVSKKSHYSPHTKDLRTRRQ